MRRTWPILAAMLAMAVWVPAPAQASFGFLPGSEGFDVAVQDEGGVGVKTQAGSHPYVISTSVDVSGGDLRNLDLELPAGLIENPSAVTKCTQARFHEARVSPFEASRSGENCPALSQIGTIEIRSDAVGNPVRGFGLFNLEPAPGFPAQIGASPFGVPMVFTPHLREASGEYGITLALRNLSQRIAIHGFTLDIWGNPWGLSHNGERGNCLNEAEPTFPWAKCPISPPQPDHTPFAYLTLPASCSGPLAFNVIATAWGETTPVSATVPSRDEEGNPAGLKGCNILRFEPLTFAQPTNFRASSRYRLRLLSDPQRRSADQLQKQRPLAAAHRGGDAAGGDDDQPLAGGRPRGLHARRLRGRDGELATRRGLPGELQDRQASPSPARSSKT